MYLKKFIAIVVLTFSCNNYLDKIDNISLKETNDDHSREYNNIIYYSHFNEGNFSSTFPHIEYGKITIWGGGPPYGRPLDYGGQYSSHVGNGDLMWLTAE